MPSKLNRNTNGRPLAYMGCQGRAGNGALPKGLGHEFQEIGPQESARHVVRWMAVAPKVFVSKRESGMHSKGLAVHLLPTDLSPVRYNAQ